MEISAEQRAAMERLRNNIENIFLRIVIPQNEQDIFNKYLILTLEYGISCGVENAYLINADNSRKFNHVVGGRKSICMSNAFQSIQLETLGSYLLFHNHPNSLSPSYDDLLSFLPQGTVKSMAVCGHIGNLYFIQKSFDFCQLTEHIIMGILEDIKKMWRLFCERCKEVSNQISQERLTTNKEAQITFVRTATNLFFDRISAMFQKYGFQCYRDEVM